MTKRLILSVFLLLAFSCDAPRDARSRTGGAISAIQNSPYSQGTSGSDRSFNIDDDSTSGGSNAGLPTEIQHCQWSRDGVNGYQSTSSHLGSYTLCQSRSPETDVYLQMRNPISDAQLCLIPTFNNGTSSIYIGEPRCLSVTDSKRVYKIGFIKNRPGYSNFAVTGAMVMKDKAFFYPAPFYQYVLSPDAYIYCSKALDKQPSDPRYCQAFKSLGEYQYHQF